MVNKQQKNLTLTVEKVTFTRAVSSNHYIMTLVKWLDNRLVFITFEALNYNLKRRKIKKNVKERP